MLTLYGNQFFSAATQFKPSFMHLCSSSESLAPGNFHLIFLIELCWCCCWSKLACLSVQRKQRKKGVSSLSISILNFLRGNLWTLKKFATTTGSHHLVSNWIVCHYYRFGCTWASNFKAICIIRSSLIANAHIFPWHVSKKLRSPSVQSSFCIVCL